MRYKAELMEVGFDTITEGMNVEQKLSKLYSILESATALIFTEKKEIITNEEAKEENDEKKRSKNKIPKDIRLLMRQIMEISERIKKSNYWLRTVNLTKELEAKEAILAEKYKERKLAVEREAIKRIKSGPKYFTETYSMITR